MAIRVMLPEEESPAYGDGSALAKPARTNFWVKPARRPSLRKKAGGEIRLAAITLEMLSEPLPPRCRPKNALRWLMLSGQCWIVLKSWITAPSESLPCATMGCALLKGHVTTPPEVSNFVAQLSQLWTLCTRIFTV